MASERIEQLIADLRRSTSGLEQLKLLTRAWSTVRRMSRKERVELATHVGLAEAKTLLERFGQPGGVSPARLAEAVLKAERANPGELNRLLSDLRDSEKRAEAVRKTVRLAEAAIEDMGAGPAPESETKKPTVPPVMTGPEAEEREAVPTAMPAKPPPLKTVATPAIPPPSLQTETDSVGQEEPSPDTAAPPESAEKRAPKKAREEPPTEIADSRPPKTEPKSAPSPAAKPAPARPLPSRGFALETEPTLIGRFRLLHSAAGEGAMSEEDVAGALQAFPPGWPRRRALAALIRTGTVRELDPILAALSQLTHPRDEFWCLSALAQSRELTLEELDKLMGGVSHGSSRRLLRRLRDRRRSVSVS